MMKETLHASCGHHAIHDQQVIRGAKGPSHVALELRARREMQDAKHSVIMHDEHNRLKNKGFGAGGG